MTEKLRPGVFSRYSAGPAGGYTGVRNAGLIAKGAAEKTGWAATPAELAALFPAEGDAALRQAGDWLLRHGAGRLWAASVADDSGYAAAFAASEGVDGLDTLLCDGATAAVAAAFAESLAAAAENRRERVGVLAVGADSPALAAAAAAGSERLLVTAGTASETEGETGSALLLGAALAGALLRRTAPDLNLGGAVMEGLAACSPARTEAQVEAALRGGVVPFELVGEQVECIRGVTSRADSTWRDISTLLTVDDVMVSVRERLTAALRGVRSSAQSLEAVASLVTVLLREKEEAGLLSGWSAPVVYTKAEDPSVCVVELSFGVARVVSRITVTASIAL